METRQSQLRSWMGRMLLLASVVAMLAAGPVPPAIAASRIDIPGPPGSEEFGYSVTALPNGNIVVTDPYYDAGAVQDVGAVYLYDGATGLLISMLTGSTEKDQVGWAGVKVLPNGNYLVVSPSWQNGSTVSAGAVTWCSATSGVHGVVSEFNSLVGEPGHGFGCAGRDCIDTVTVLANGNYVVRSPGWDNGFPYDVGAVTWGSGTTGVSGVVSAVNSLVGSMYEDRIGDWVEPLSNGNYLVLSPTWNNGPLRDAGAVTWGSGTTGVSGIVSAANSLVGGGAWDQIGSTGVRELSSGNYLILSPYWSNGVGWEAGAVTWGSGVSGVSGVVSAQNSLVGSSEDDHLGYELSTVIELSNGNYVVISPYWDNGWVEDAGAATWGSGISGVRGAVSSAISLVGSSAHDGVGWYSTKALGNGNYVVVSPSWDNGVVPNAGAVTWGDGSRGTKGVVSIANSLVGTSSGDRVGTGHYGVTELIGGNYVVSSPTWDNGTLVDVGAVTLGSGTSGIKGAVSPANSLVGTAAGNRVGCVDDECYGSGVVALSSGNYVVCSPYWDNGTAVDVGAATWQSGTAGSHGSVSPANSLVGSTPGDQVGSRVVPLGNGNYVVESRGWDNGTVVNAGAVTWGSGIAGIRGVASAANSLVGSTDGDWAGYVIPLSNGNYVIHSPLWDNGLAADVGAVTWWNGTVPTGGTLSTANSLVGSTSGDMQSAYVKELFNGNYVVVSHGWDNSTGAVTWGSGTMGVRGVVSESNSLVGSSPGDLVGCGDQYCLYPVTLLPNGNYVVVSGYWDNGTVVDAGAVTWGSGTTGARGVVSPANSLVGSSDYEGYAVVNRVTTLSNGDYVVETLGAITLGAGTGGTAGPITEENSVIGGRDWAYDSVNGQLVVGRPDDNIVTLFRLPVYAVFLPVALKNVPQ